MKKAIFFSMILLLVAQLTLAQEKIKKTQPPAPEVRKAKLTLAARSVKGQILLRWAPDQPFAWKAANQYGYILERFTISRNDTILSKPEMILSKQAIRPQPLKVWDSIITKSDYAAAMAQAIYGEDFEVEMKDEKGLAKIINKTEELKQRFMMSLYAADHDFFSARYAGLGWIDKTVKPNEKYLYRIYTRIPKDKVIMDTALAFIGLKDTIELPKPAEVVAEFGDKSAMLSWDFDNYIPYYHSYYIEKSVDAGKTFIRTSNLPLTKGTEQSIGGAASSGLLYFIDSLEKNGHEYQYRIAGVNIFGEVGPYSTIIKGKGVFQLLAVPGISGITLNDKKQPELNWEFDEAFNSAIQSFEIRQSNTIDGEYKAIVQGIKPHIRKIQLDSVPAVAYVKVAAIPLEGTPKTSNPYLVQPEDSLPPSVPIGFVGSIDSSGVVSLKWDANKEPDLLGYKVFRTYVKTNEYTPVVDSVVKNHLFTDTIPLKNLNSKVYYTITAVDQHYNQSTFSTILEIKKPDVIPPTQPVFSSYELTETALILKWINSMDADVQRHLLYRKEQDSTNWKKVAEISDRKVQHYVDAIAEGGKQFSYTLIAVDSAGLESAPSIPIAVVIPKSRVKEAVNKLDAMADREARKILISWQVVATNVLQLELYRGEDKVGMSLYKVLKANETAFTDQELRVNTKYKYAIRAVYTDGKYSDFKMKTITY